jgi:hypothetical protein
MSTRQQLANRILCFHVAFGLLLGGALCAFCGCSTRLPESARKLVGTWELAQPERLAERINQLPEDSSLPAAEPEEQDAEPAGSGMVLEFRTDGTLQTKTALGQLQQQKQGTWQFISASADSRTLAIRCQLNQQSSEVEVEFLEGETISLVPPNLAGLNTKLRFRRAQ